MKKNLLKKCSKAYLEWGMSLTPKQSFDLMEEQRKFIYKFKPIMTREIWKEFKYRWYWPD